MSGGTRINTWLTAAGVAAGVLFAAALGIYSYITATTPTLHPNPQNVPAVIDTPPAAKWADAVEQGRQLARAMLVEQNLPGLSVAVGMGGEIVWAEGFGWADVEKQVRVTPGSRFRIGHASKPLTSAAVGVLVEQRRLHLDDEIQKHVPSFPAKQWPITVRQLMGHVAGIRHYRGEADYTTTDHCERASDGLRTFADDPLRFEPETKYGYSTYGWVLVSAAIEAVAGEPFFSFMRTKIFEALGMRDTTVDSPAEPIPDRVAFYHPRFSGESTSGPDLVDPIDYSCLAGGGAFLSTPSDLVRFGMALNSGTLLRPETVKKLQSPQLLTSGQETDYGLGWMLYGGSAAGHVSITLYGSSTSFLTYPERGIVVAVTTNISSTHTRQIAENIAAAFAAKSTNPAR